MIGPEVGVGEAAGKDLVANVHRTEPGRRLEGTEAKLSFAEVEGAERIDHHSVADRLAGQDVPVWME